MAKRKKAAASHKRSNENLMLLAGAAVIIVGFFAIFAYRGGSIMGLPTSTPAFNPISTVNLNAQNKSGESGVATLQEVGGKVTVSISLSGFPAGTTQPAHIHVGSCPNPGAVKYPLTSVVNGQSVTVLNLTMAELQSMGPLAINVHKSVPQSSIYYSCGNLTL